MHIDDIEKVRSRKPLNKPVRDIMNVSDIQGAQCRARTNNRSTSYNSICYNDVTAKTGVSQRNTNPLQPEYAVRDTPAEAQVDIFSMTKTVLNKKYGPIDGNRPCALPGAIPGGCNLTTTDVAGAQADTKRIGPFTHYQRRADQIRPVGRNDDVEGSRAGSLKRGITTIRATNPLQPDYQVPGRTVNGASGFEINNPYGRKLAETSKSVSFAPSKLAETGKAAMQSKSKAQQLDGFVNK